MVAEVQESEDLSILLEWRAFKMEGREHGHLGLGFKTALGAVETKMRIGKEIEGLVGHENAIGSVLVLESTEYFVLERLRFEGQEVCQGGFAIVIVLEGRMELLSKHGKFIWVGKGGITVVPHAAGKLTLSGTGEALIARPPRTG